MNKEIESLEVTEPVAGEAPSQLAVLDRALIVRSKTNPRTHFDADYIKELAASIREHGILQPILVRPLPADRLQDTFEDREPGAPLPTHELVCGECRWRGAGEAGVDELPVLVRHLSDIQVLQVQLVENLKRRDLHPMEEAEGLGRLISDHGMTADDIADKVKKSRSYVYKSLKLLELTSECREQLYAGKLTQSTALLVARAPAHLQLQIAKEIMHVGYDGEPMSFRQAARHIHDRYMLQLATAIFDVTDAKLVPKAGDCKACPKRTGAHTDLFEDVKSADTCTDPKCFDDKKVAHYAAIAKAAEAKGQKVIMGKEAKELMPTQYSKPKGYTLLDESAYIEGVGSRSVRKLLGKDAPQPVLIVNPHNQQLQEALPDDVATKLLRQATSKAKSEAKAGKANKEPTTHELERQYDDAWQGKVVERVHGALMAGKMQEISVDIARAIAMHYASNLYGEACERFGKLFGVGKVGRRDGIEEFLKDCPANQVAPALLVLMLEEEFLEGGGMDGKFPVVELIAGATDVDAEAARAEAKIEMKAAADARKAAAPATGKATGRKTGQRPVATKKKAGDPAFMAPLQPSELLAAVIGNEPMPRTEIVAKIWAYIKKHGLHDKTNKRMVNTDEKLRALFGKDQVSMFEMAGLIGKHVGNVRGEKPGAPQTGKKKTSAKEAQEGIAQALQEQVGGGAVDKSNETIEAATWPLPIAPSAGCRIKVKDDAKGPTGHFRKIRAKEGVLEKFNGSAWIARIDGSKDTHVISAFDFTVLSGPVHDVGKSPGPKKPLEPQGAWPFPTAKTVGKGAPK